VNSNSLQGIQCFFTVSWAGYTSHSEPSYWKLADVLSSTRTSLNPTRVQLLRYLQWAHDVFCSSSLEILGPVAPWTRVSRDSCSLDSNPFSTKRSSPRWKRKLNTCQCRQFFFVKDNCRSFCHGDPKSTSLVQVLPDVGQSYKPRL
jgi:hypothetical protein